MRHAVYNNKCNFYIYLQAVEEYGKAVERSLIAYKKSIMDEQFVLNRLADAAIDTYSMAVVLSRASRSLEKNLPSAPHEVNSP
jgi:very long chain acyl-CoA dehydrogenase